MAIVKTKVFVADMDYMGVIKIGSASAACNKFLETLDYVDVISVTPSFAASQIMGGFVITVVYKKWQDDETVESDYSATPSIPK